MRRISIRNLAWAAALMTFVVVSIAPMAFASTPPANSAVIKTRVFNDCSTSTVTTNNLYPAFVIIEDANVSCSPGFANLHNWHLSTDGATGAPFNNDSNFRLAADLVIDGSGQAEAGLQVAPWWSKDVDGRLNVRTTDGEIACFGGRLPFFSFTGTYGLHYAKGTAIHVEVKYLSHGLTQLDPATIQYTVVYGGFPFSSPVLPFDQGNPAEDPPYGQWGMLNDGRVGGHMQVFMNPQIPDATVNAAWRDIVFEVLDVVPDAASSFGQIKALYR